MSKNNGGGAFPSPGVIFNGHQQGAYEGMTLRDYFAAKALQGHMANSNFSPDAHARRAYEVADAMLKERAK
jgi:hypothetical protein